MSTDHPPTFDPFGPPPEGEGVTVTGTMPDPELEKAISQSFQYLLSRHDKAVQDRMTTVRVNLPELHLLLIAFNAMMAAQRSQD